MVMDVFYVVYCLTPECLDRKTGDLEKQSDYICVSPAGNCKTCYCFITALDRDSGGAYYLYRGLGVDCWALSSAYGVSIIYKLEDYDNLPGREGLHLLLHVMLFFIEVTDGYVL
ncbi:MAG: hypothetical protein GY702_12145 [Desulfobulbaceae bacterium]|nr:hypothetical protein [Desulfobulbaceae bacterium]